MELNREAIRIATLTKKLRENGIKITYKSFECDKAKCCYFWLNYNNKGSCFLKSEIGKEIKGEKIPKWCPQKKEKRVIGCEYNI